MSDLERRYRRLLRAYPASYRAAREDEIVAVLLDAAPPEKQRPSAADALDLVRGGLVARWRAGRGARRGVRVPTPWGDALAVVTVVLPMLLAARVLRGAQMATALIGADWNWHPYAGQFLRGWPGPVAWVLAAALVVARRPRLALIAAAGGVALDVTDVVLLARDGNAYLAQGRVAVVLISAAGAALLARRGAVGRGVELVGRMNLALVAGGAALVDMGLNHLWLGRDAILGRGLTLPAALVLFAIVACRRRQMLVDPRLAVRLAIVASAAFAAVLMSDAVRRVTNLGRMTPGSLVLELVLCAMASAVVLVAAALLAAGSRAVVRQIRATDPEKLSSGAP